MSVIFSDPKLLSLLSKIGGGVKERVALRGGRSRIGSLSLGNGRGALRSK